MKEYIIYGTLHGETLEQVIIEKLHGKRLTSKTTADKVAALVLERSQDKLQTVRVAEVDLSDAPDFSKVFKKKACNRADRFFS